MRASGPLRWTERTGLTQRSNRWRKISPRLSFMQARDHPSPSRVDDDLIPRGERVRHLRVAGLAAVSYRTNLLPYHREGGHLMARREDPLADQKARGRYLGGKVPFGFRRGGASVTRIEARAKRRMSATCLGSSIGLTASAAHSRRASPPQMAKWVSGRLGRA